LLAGFLAGWLAGRPAGWLAVCLFGWLAGQNQYFPHFRLFVFRLFCNHKLWLNNNTTSNLNMKIFQTKFNNLSLINHW
jgi:hypothetical protein